MSTIREELTSMIENMDTKKLGCLWNEYVSQSNRMDDYIYFMDEFDEVMENESPWEVVRAAYYSGKFCPAHDYFWFDGYANLVSAYTTDLSGPDCPICIPEIVDFILENDDALYNIDIEDFLDSKVRKSETLLHSRL